MADRTLSSLWFWAQRRQPARPGRRLPSAKPPPPRRDPRPPTPSPPERSPPREAIESPSPSRTPSKRQPSIPDASPGPTLSRSDSKRKLESPKTSRPSPSPALSTEPTQTQDQAIPQVHEPKESPKVSIEVGPPKATRPPSPSSPSTAQRQAPAVSQVHAPYQSPSPSPSPSPTPTPRTAHSLIPARASSSTPSPTPTPKTTPSPVRSASPSPSPTPKTTPSPVRRSPSPTPSPSPSPSPTPKTTPSPSPPLSPTSKTTPSPYPSPTPETAASPSPAQTASSTPTPFSSTQTHAPNIPQTHDPEEPYNSIDKLAPKTTETPSPSQSLKLSSQAISQEYEKQDQPSTQAQKEIPSQVTSQPDKEPKQPEDLEAKSIPTYPIEKQTSPENGTKETKAKNIIIAEDQKEGNVEEPPKSLERKTKLVSIQEEEHKPKPETTMPEKLQIGITQEREKIIEPKSSSIRLDSKPPIPPTDTSRLITKMRISKQKARDDRDDSDGEEPTRSSFNGKESKIKISGIPRDSSPTGEQNTFQAEIKEGISKLVEKLSIGHSELLGNGNGVIIVTLAGENKGASMVIGFDRLTKDSSNHIQKETQANKNVDRIQREGSTHARDEIPPISASINSNVQSVNNSLLHESSCNEENPGVHLVFSSKPMMPVKMNGKPESTEKVETIPKTVQAQKLTYTPRVRRRCLRGLLLESSESDREDLQKPQRHGCRVACDGRNNVKADIEDASASINNERNIN